MQSAGDFAMIVGSAQAEYRQACLLRPLHQDFEDDLVVACAMHNGADLLVTSGDDLVRHALVACLTPHDAVLMVGATS